jgi:predicted nucleotidyltransferase component of viral defense system
MAAKFYSKELIDITKIILKKKFDFHKHKAVLVQILRDIFSHKDLRTSLGFKGGTAAMIFYGLDRASVDLDFNLLDKEKEDLILEELPKILRKYGSVIDQRKKRYTLFFLLDYGMEEKKVKIEISRRESMAKFSPMDYLGIAIPVMVEEDTLAHKLCALLTRKRFASRDMYDVNFFLKKGWDINEDIVKEQTGLSLKEALQEAIRIILSIKKSAVLNGLGELVQEEAKDKIKESLASELVFNLKLYLSGCAE